FNVSLGTDTLFAEKLLPDTYPAPIDRCNSTCGFVQNTLKGANNNTNVICANQTANDLIACEQCMFQALVDTNQRMPDPRAGSNPVLTGYGAACTLFNFTLANATKLAIANNWDGPFGMFVPTGGLVVTVGVGAILGVSSIVLLSSM
ncbi:hypothetical protein K435DRAFT_661956, partial [Dendrothele bispora CBS 962.96]